MILVLKPEILKKNRRLEYQPQLMMISKPEDNGRNFTNVPTFKNTQSYENKFDFRGLEFYLRKIYLYKEPHLFIQSSLQEYKETGHLTFGGLFQCEEQIPSIPCPSC